MESLTVDFAGFAKGDDEKRFKVSQDLVKKLQEHGTARLINCGISKSVSSQYMQLATAFFSLPSHVKQRIAITPSPQPQRGYGAIGSEILANLLDNTENGVPTKSERRDIREHFDAGPPGATRFPSVWPEAEQVPNFQRDMETYWRIFQDISFEILAAIELGLGLPAATFKSRCLEPASETRFNHYPSVPLAVLANGKRQRAFPHTDVGLISLLFLDQVAGLEIENRACSTPGHPSFKPMPLGDIEDHGDIVLLVGETMERWTNGRIKAAMHQVSSHFSGTGEDAECPERYSGAFFAKPNFDASVAPLAQFVTKDLPARYDNITYLDFHQQRVAKIYNTTI